MDEMYVEIPYSKNIWISNYGNVKKINEDGSVKQIKTYLIGPKNHKELVFSAPYFGTVGYYPKLSVAYIVAFLFLNNNVDYRSVKIAHKDNNPSNCRSDNLILYETDLPLSIQFVRGCILPEKIEQFKNNIKKQYQKRKDKNV